MKLDKNTIPEGEFSPDSIDGEPQAQLIGIQGATQRLTFVIDRPVLTIGRQQDNDFVLPSEKVSRHHGRISCEGGAYFYEDLRSFNGSFLNGRKLEPERRFTIRHRDMLQLTDFRLLFLNWAALANQLGLATINLDSDRVRKEAEDILKDFL